MAKARTIGPTTVVSWVRENVVEAGPSWIQLVRSALAHVRVR